MKLCLSVRLSVSTASVCGLGSVRSELTQLLVIGTVLPGLIIVGSTLGQTVMTLQGSDSDGVATPSSEWLRASDGISPARELVETVFLSGATVSVNAPLGSNLVSGLSVAWKTYVFSNFFFLCVCKLTLGGCRYGTVLDDALIQDEVALHVVRVA